jgi:hypothetical protein
LHPGSPVLELCLGSGVLSLVDFGFLDEEPFNDLQPLLEFGFEELDPVTLWEVVVFGQLIGVDSETLLFGSHEFDGLTDIFFELICISEEFLSCFKLRASPVVALFTVEHRVVYTLYHVVEDLHRVGSDLTVKHLFVREFRCVDSFLVLWQHSEEPYCFVLDSLGVSVGEKKDGFDNRVISVTSSFGCLIVCEELWWTFSIKESFENLFVFFMK